MASRRAHLKKGGPGYCTGCVSDELGPVIIVGETTRFRQETWLCMKCAAAVARVYARVAENESNAKEDDRG